MQQLVARSRGSRTHPGLRAFAHYAGSQEAAFSEVPRLADSFCATRFRQLRGLLAARLLSRAIGFNENRARVHVVQALACSFLLVDLLGPRSVPELSALLRL